MDLISDLKNNIESLEKLFLGITQNYPRTLSYISNYIQEMNEDFSDVNSSTCLQSATFDFNEQIDCYKNELLKQEEQSNVVQTIKSIEILSSRVKQDIQTIQDESQYLELLSLNAMVSALKSGKNGGAFPFLTKEMQKLSIQCHKNSDSLLCYGRRLQTNLSEMNRDISITLSNEEKSLNSLNDKTQYFLKSIKDFEEDFRIHLQQLDKKSKAIKTSIYDILGELQKHDIIRQSLDHIIFSIQFSENLTMNSIEDELDYLKYSKDMYQFSTNILKEVIQDLSRTSILFKENYNRITSSILSLEIDSKSMQTIETKIHDIMEDIQKKQNLDHSSLDNKKEIFNTIENLSLIASDFSSIMKQMKMVNISNRIEYSRNPDINGIDHIINDIEEKSITMQSCIDTSIESFHAIQKRMFSLFDELHQNTGENSVFETRFKDSAISCLSQFVTIVNSMTKKQEAFHSFLKDFDLLSQEIKKDIMETESVIESFSSLSKVTEQKMVEYRDRFEVLLERTGYEFWSLKNIEIHNIIDRFTILTHKKNFSEDSANEIEQGASNGEVVLF